MVLYRCRKLLRLLCNFLPIIQSIATSSPPARKFYLLGIHSARNTIDGQRSHGLQSMQTRISPLEVKRDLLVSKNPCSSFLHLCISVIRFARVLRVSTKHICKISKIWHLHTSMNSLLKLWAIAYYFNLDHLMPQTCEFSFNFPLSLAPKPWVFCSSISF